MQLLLSIIIAISSVTASAEEKFFAEKILQVSVDEIGTVSVGRDTVGADNLARYIQERLFKSYLGTGQMHGKIIISKENSDVPEIIMQVVLKEVQEGQRKALTQVCLQKYKNLFEKIDSRKQAKLKNSFQCCSRRTTNKFQVKKSCAGVMRIVFIHPHT